LILFDELVDGFFSPSSLSTRALSPPAPDPLTALLLGFPLAPAMKSLIEC
jgi:hypothetical protein